MSKKFIICALLLFFLAGCGTDGTAADVMSNAGNMVKNREESMIESSNSGQAFSYQKSDDSNQKESTEVLVEDEDPNSDHQIFTFTRKSNNFENAQGTIVLTENRCDIRFLSEEGEEKEWIDGILLDHQKEYDANSSKLIQYADEVISQYGSESFYTYSNYEDQGIVRHDSRVASIVAINNMYSGGAHPNTVQTVQNLDLKNHRVLKLEDVIYETSASELVQMVQDAVKNKYEHLDVDALYSNYADTIETSMRYGSMTSCWYFNYDSLVIFFNQYELGPYASGIIKVEVPYRKLSGILREEFFPEKHDQCTGNLRVVTDLQGQAPISCVIDPEGSQIYIQADGLVQSVQVSEILWVDDIPVSQSMMISIDQMDQQDALSLTGGFDDETRSFAIEYTNDCGERIVYYIHPEGLTQTP